jgi:hypothetical protein
MNQHPSLHSFTGNAAETYIYPQCIIRIFFLASRFFSSHY